MRAKIRGKSRGLPSAKRVSNESSRSSSHKEGTGNERSQSMPDFKTRFIAWLERRVAEGVIAAVGALCITGIVMWANIRDLIDYRDECKQWRTIVEQRIRENAVQLARVEGELDADARIGLQLQKEIGHIVQKSVDTTRGTK
jgi:hypothetical protein